MIAHPNASRHNQLIVKYYVPNMGDYSVVGGYLSSILERLDVNGLLPIEDKQFIRDKGLFDLFDFVEMLEKTGKPDFRILRAKFERQEKAALRKELWQKYDIEYIEAAHMRQMMAILCGVERGDRMSDKDVVWLTNNNYFSSGLKREFHKIEANFWCQSFEKNNNQRHAVNSSSHYRKAGLASEAIHLLEKIDIDIQNDKRLKSALYTTKGGAKRDLKQLDEALHLAERAHQADSRSFHPCTLLGAINYEKRNYALGDEWFAKAIDRGAKVEGVDRELRSIFMRADKMQKDELREHLLKINPVRYEWANQPKSTKKSKG